MLPTLTFALIVTFLAAWYLARNFGFTLTFTSFAPPALMLALAGLVAGLLLRPFASPRIVNLHLFGAACRGHLTRSVSTLPLSVPTLGRPCVRISELSWLLL